MEEQSFFTNFLVNLRSSCKYYTGYPKDLGPSKVIHFTSEREFVQLLHQGYPVVVAFTIKSNYSKHLDKVFEESAAEFYPHVKFLRVECPKYPGFCITRQKKEYPFVEMFHSPEQAAAQGRVADPNITKYSVKVLPVKVIFKMGEFTSSPSLGESEKSKICVIPSLHLTSKTCVLLALENCDYHKLLGTSGCGVVRLS
ncbi:hypothetical protein KY290_030842 [Solanum tuberosum]|uniref:Uncharacterized protein n=1 Tax=Solanum tuberosum TaxID=4113 RepID=A0ABQ7U9E2_SOLTU|nr:hypothetical protein KY290_030842 [Solanum tuberosum]